MRRRDYDDDLDQPKRSSPYQDLHEQDEDGYDDYDDYEDDDMMDEPRERKSTVRKKSSRSASTRMKLLSVVIVVAALSLPLAKQNLSLAKARRAGKGETK